MRVGVVRGVQSVLGFVPLGAYLVYHLREVWPALESREAWLAQQQQSLSASAIAVLVLLPMAIHLVLGSWRLWRAPEAGHEARGRGRVQAVTGALVVGFLALHLAHVWGWEPGPHATALRAYDELWQELTRPLPLLVYAVGISAVCLHLTHGVSRVLERTLAAGDARLVQVARLVCGLLGLALWAAWVQVLGQFAIGEPLLPLPW